MKKLTIKKCLIIVIPILVLVIGIIIFSINTKAILKEEKLQSKNKKQSIEIIDNEKEDRVEIEETDNVENDTNQNSEDSNSNNSDTSKKSSNNQSKKESSNNTNSSNSANSSSSNSTNNNSNNNSTNNSTNNSNNTNNNNNTGNTNNNHTQQPVVDNSVNTSHWDYSIHKGRIDCYSSDSCNNKSLPIYSKFINSISNVWYVDVMSNSNTSLGYFIEYVFKENDYSTQSECEQNGNAIKSTLSDRVTSYSCTPNGNSYRLKIYTDYD